ncbi:tRNA pseudouridine55 synthase [Pedobacter sp. UYEF25]
MPNTPIIGALPQKKGSRFTLQSFCSLLAKRIFTAIANRKNHISQKKVLIEKKPIEDLNFAEGELLLFNKPYKWTSFDVVGKIRNSLKPLKLKVGHAGTLDPLATGLLILCTGKLTKQIDSFQAEEKEYVGTMILGATTPSFDLETAIDQIFDISNISTEDILSVRDFFLGEIVQYPPAHSAVKINGERLYVKARLGEEVELRPRYVTVSEFEITNINFPEIEFKVVCSKGTYIRSIVSDFGKKLQNGAYLSKLTRTRSGKFLLSNAYEVQDFVAQLKTIKETNKLLET